MANEYVTAAAVKSALSLTGTSFADADIARASEAASRACDDYKAATSGPSRVKFWKDGTNTARVFSPRPSDYCIVFDCPLADTASVTVDTNGDGTYDETWVEGTDFDYDPVNAAADGLPFFGLSLHWQGRAYFPSLYPRSVKVTGKWGWDAVPPQVEQAALFLTVRWLMRSRSAPLGIVLAEGADAARLGRLDNEAMGLLDLVWPRRQGSGSLQLG